MFTANPITAIRINCINAVSLESIVSGQSPDTITGGKVCHIPVNKLALRRYDQYSAGGGTMEIRSQQNYEASALSDQQLQELVAIGIELRNIIDLRRILRIFSGTIYILQAPAVTTFSRSEPPYIDGDYNRTMFIEIFPIPVTDFPLGGQPLFQDMLDFTFLTLGFAPPQNLNAIGVFYNQPYFNRLHCALKSFVACGQRAPHCPDP
jgi:hypothetical protein